MKVLVLSNVPSPYFVDFMNELGKFCDLTVVFEKKTSTIRDKSWLNFRFINFKGVILKGIPTGEANAFSPGVRKFLKKGMFDQIIVTNMCTPTGMYAVSILKRRKIPYMLQSEGGIAKDGKGWKERLKKHIMRGAAGYLSTTKLGAEYFLQYGATEDKLHKFIFPSLYDKEVLKEPVCMEEKRRLREELGISENKAIISVGQFIYRKGFDVLLKAAEGFPESVGFYFVGGEPTEEYLDLQRKLGLKNVHFIGFKNKESLLKYYRAADLFVLPTRNDTWGLVINEAMAQGLPVITTTRCVAGTEFVQDGETGYLVPPDDVGALHDAMEKVIFDNALLEKMSENSLKKAQGYTFEKAAARHMEILNER